MFEDRQNLTIVVSSAGLTQDTETIEFTASGLGSFPQSFTPSVLLPISLTLTEASRGSVTASSVHNGVEVSLVISYSPDANSPSQVPLLLSASQIDLEVLGTRISFSSLSNLTRAQVTEHVATVDGTLNVTPLPEVTATTEADPEDEGTLSWTLETDDPLPLDPYLPLLPALVVPVGWFTASRDREDLRNGEQLSADGMFESRVEIVFVTGEMLTLEVVSTGFDPTQPGRVQYTYTISGLHPPGFNASQILPLEVPIQSNVPGHVEGNSTLQDGSSLTVQISFTPLPLLPLPPSAVLIVDLSVPVFSRNGTVLTFETDSRLAPPTIPTASPTPTPPTAPPTATLASPTPAVSPTPTPSIPVVDTVNGSLDVELTDGTPFTTAQIQIRRNRRLTGRLDWSITLADAGLSEELLSVFSSLIIPFAWLHSDTTPAEVADGLQVTGDGKFNATLLLMFEDRQNLTIVVSSAGLTQDTETIEFTARALGSFPQSFTPSVLLPISLTLTEAIRGFITASTVHNGVEVSLVISYSPDANSPSQVPLLLSANQIDLEVIGTRISFSSLSNLTRAQVTEHVATVDGTLNVTPLPEVTATTEADPEDEGALSWTLETDDPLPLDPYLPLLPALVVPVGWFTASRDREDLRNGEQLSADGMFESRVEIVFVTGEMLTLEVVSTGFDPTQPGRVQYTYTISGLHPPGFNASQILPLEVPIQSNVPGRVEGSSTLQDGSSLTVQISFPPLPLLPLPPSAVLIVDLSVPVFSRNGTELSFDTDSRLSPPTIATASPTPTPPTAPPTAPLASPTPAVSPTPTPSIPVVDTVNGSLDVDLTDGTPFTTAQIQIRRNRRQTGRLDWSITLADAGLSDELLSVFSSLIIPFAWLHSDTIPAEVADGLQVTGDGKFNATLLLMFEDRQNLTIVVSSARLTQDTETIEFTASAFDSFPQSFTPSVLLPISLTLTEAIRGFITASSVHNGVEVSLVISYSPDANSPSQVPLLLSASQIDLEVIGTRISFSSLSNLTRAQVTEHVATVDGTLNGTPLPEVTATTEADPEDEGTLSWTLETDDPLPLDPYLPLLPALVVPVGWFTASRDREDLMNGEQLSADGMFESTVEIVFVTGEKLTVEVVSTGFDPTQPGRVQYTYTISGSHPPGFNASQILPLEVPIQSNVPGRVEGNSTLLDGSSLTVQISFPPLPLLPLPPSAVLIVDLSVPVFSRNGTVLTFETDSRLAPPTIATASPTPTPPTAPPTATLASPTPAVSPTPTPSIPVVLISLFGEIGGTTFPETLIEVFDDVSFQNWRINLAKDSPRVVQFLNILPLLTPMYSVLLNEDVHVEGSVNGSLLREITNAEVTVDFSTGHRLVLIHSRTGDDMFVIEVVGSYPNNFRPSREILSTTVLVTENTRHRSVFKFFVDRSPAILTAYHDDNVVIPVNTTVTEERFNLNVQNNTITFSIATSVNESIQCNCSGLSDECDILTRECLNCQLNTTGVACTDCLPGYYPTNANNLTEGCSPCSCPGLPGSNQIFSNSCRIESQELICLDCVEGHSGPRCNECADGYFGNPIRGIQCQRCQCSGNIDITLPGNCNTTSGECLQCLNNTTGFSCENCVPGYWGDATERVCRGELLLLCCYQHFSFIPPPLRSYEHAKKNALVHRPWFLSLAKQDAVGKGAVKGQNGPKFSFVATSSEEL